MNVCTHIARRVFAGKGFFTYLATGEARQVGIGATTYPYRTIGKTAQHGKTVTESLFVFLDHQCRLLGQRIGIKNGNENGIRGATRRRYLAEGASPQQGPLARVHQLLLYRFTAQAGDLLRAVGIKGDFVFLLGHFNHYRLKDALVATIDRHHLAGGRSGVFHTLGFLVREDQLAFLDHVSLADLHGGFHAHIVTAEHGNRTNLVAFLNRLARCTSDGQIQALPDFNHSFSPTLRVAEVEAHPPASPEKREMPWMFAKTGICTWEPATSRRRHYKDAPARSPAPCDPSFVAQNHFAAKENPVMHRKKARSAGFFSNAVQSFGYAGYSTPEICCRIRSTWQL